MKRIFCLFMVLALLTLPACSLLPPAPTEPSASAETEPSKTTPAEVSSETLPTVPVVPAPEATVRLSEAIAEDPFGLADEDGECPGWAELVNTGDAPADLSRYALSDRDTEPLRSPLSGTLAPGERAVIFLSGKDTADSANFRLSEGEPLILSFLGAPVDTVTFPADAPKGLSRARREDGSWGWAVPTPGEANGEPFETPGEAAALRRGPLYISEVCAASASGPDWVELANDGEEPVTLEGVLLTDRTDGEKGVTLSGTLAPGEYLVLTEGKDFVFGVKGAGETLYLADAEGHALDIFFTGEQTDGLTTGRSFGQSRECLVYETATPGAPNPETAGRTAAPILEETSLYLDGPTALRVTSATPGAQVFVTRDGTDPTKFGSPCGDTVTVAPGQTLRAAAKAEGCAWSAEAAACFLPASERRDLPVVCLAGDEAQVCEVLEESTLTYRPEAEVQVLFYEDGALRVSFPAMIHAKGSSSLGMRQKSLQVDLKASLGQSRVDYPFFGEDGRTRFTSLELRQSGQDSTEARMKDSLVANLCQTLACPTFRSLPAVMFVNGAYWGIYDLKEDLDKDHFSALYGGRASAVRFADGDARVKGEDAQNYAELAAEIRRLPVETSEGYEALCALVDEASVMDLILARVFFGDVDAANLKLMQTESGPWVAVLEDMDWCMGDDEDPYTDASGLWTVETPLDRERRPHDRTVLYAFWQNADFRARTLARLEELIETDWREEALLAAFDAMYAALESEIPTHTARWKDNTPENWAQDALGFREALRHRAQAARAQLEEASARAEAGE